MWLAIALALVSLTGGLVARGIRSKIRLWGSPLIFWPPRIYQLIRHPTESFARSFQSRVLAGTVTIPRIGYVNDSAIVSANLWFRWENVADGLVEQQKEIIERKDGRDIFHVESKLPEIMNDTGSTIAYVTARSLATDAKITRLSIEAEIVTGLSISGNRSLRLEAPRDAFRWDWGIVFDKSGSHDLIIIFRAILDTDGVERIAELYRTPVCRIKVVSIAGMTQRQVLYLSGFSGALSIGWVVIQVLSKLQIIH